MRDFVDISSRKIASQLLRDFISGKISNDTFEARQPITHDRAIHAIWDTAWVFYHDGKEHRLEGQYRLPPEQRKACVRWILFLQSDLLYEWPDIDLPGIDPASRTQSSFLRRLFSLHQNLSEKETDTFLSAGHYPVWPFLLVSDYKTALATPKLLRGNVIHN